LSSPVVYSRQARSTDIPAAFSGSRPAYAQRGMNE
jgi:hypothetical protein